MNKTFLSLAVLGLIAIIGWYSFSSLKTKTGSTTAPERQTQSAINENEKQIENQLQQVPSR